MEKMPSVSLKVRGGKGFDCKCRKCKAEAKATWEEDSSGQLVVVIYCPKCKDNKVRL